MLPSLLLYSGLVLALVGALTLLRPFRFLHRVGLSSRRRGAAATAAGAVIAIAAALLPAPLRRVDPAESQLDRAMPEFQFHELHQLRVQATPEQVWAAIHEVTAQEIRLFRTLTWIRNPTRSLGKRGDSILAPPAHQPILGVALRSGFFVLAEERPREVVIASWILWPKDLDVKAAAAAARPSADEFAAFTKPGYARAAMNFRIDDEGGGWCRLTTETRVMATGAAARRRFGAYWRTIYPGSALIRVMWLRAIRERAQRSLSDAA